MLLTAGERISIALVSMAINDLGHEAVSFTGSQAGIVTDTSHGKARIVEMRRGRVHEALDDGQDRDRRRLPGRLDRPRRDDARPRRLRHDRRRARGGARRRRLRDLHRRRRRLHAPTRGSSRRPQAARGLVRGDARARRRAAPACWRCARSSTLATTASRSTSARRSSGRGHLDRQGGGHARTGDHLRHRARHRRGEGDDPRACPTSPGVAGRDVPAARRRRDQHRHDRPEHVRRGPHRHLLHAARRTSSSAPSRSSSSSHARSAPRASRASATSRRSPSSAPG